MKRLAISTLFLFMTALIPLQPADAAIKDGSKCSPAGANFKQNGVNFICTKISGKTIWKKKLSIQPKKETSGIQSKSFSLDSVTFSDEFGLATASARVKNISSRSKSGVMTITIFKSDGNSIFMTLTGSAQDVNSGETVTVQFIGSGSLPTGTFKYNFQVDIEF